MLRIGKKDQDENEYSQEKQDRTAYPSAQTYSSTPGVNTEPKTAADSTSSSIKAMTESETIARDIKEGTLSGFVGAGTAVTGEATFKAMLRVDGHLSGKINSGSGTLIVGTNGKVDANIEVAVAVIHGTINGDIIATQRLELGRAAKVNGNIQTPSLVIEQGGIFEGSCKMLKMTEAADKSKARKDEKPLDATSLKPISADGTTKSADAKPADAKTPVTSVSSAAN